MSRKADTQMRTVLVIEDDFINREILVTILSDRYDVVQAQNGKEGLDILKSSDKTISLILLDIQMPVMNGYEFLEAIKENSRLQSIPIIVTTSSATANDEIKCLENGATDFVAKPYNPDVVLRRVGSMIRLKEISSVINKVEHDKTTGLYNRDFFFVNAEKMLHENKKDDFDIFCCDIVSFKITQDRYGKENIDILLSDIATELKKLFGKNCIYGKLNDSVYAVLTPHLEKEVYGEIADKLRDAVNSSAIPGASVHLGLYPLIDHSTPVSILCNSAHLAITETAYQYGRQITEYNDAFQEKCLRRQAILGFMETALEEKQFDVYYQPKHCLEAGKTGGAEALVRWNHPQLGFISPGEFIPLFESSGFITELDFYIADKVCSDLRGWLDEGKPVVPISWNISRVDFGNPRLVETIKSIVDKYSIPPELVHIEVTESAYAENIDFFLSAIKELREAGFCIELDDFGAGYSLLTILSEMKIDVLKLDMYFTKNMDQKNQSLILEHIFKIAEQLDVLTVAEGVETSEQCEQYRKMGCTYIQGYYFSRPLPKAQFEEYLNNK